MRRPCHVVCHAVAAPRGLLSHGTSAGEMIAPSPTLPRTSPAPTPIALFCSSCPHLPLQSLHPIPATPEALLSRSPPSLPPLSCSPPSLSPAQLCSGRACRRQGSRRLAPSHRRTRTSKRSRRQAREAAAAAALRAAPPKSVERQSGFRIGAAGGGRRARAGAASAAAFATRHSEAWPRAHGRDYARHVAERLCQRAPQHLHV